MSCSFSQIATSLDDTLSDSVSACLLVGGKVAIGRIWDGAQRVQPIPDELPRNPTLPSLCIMYLCTVYLLKRKGDITRLSSFKAFIFPLKLLHLIRRSNSCRRNNSVFFISSFLKRRGKYD